MGGSVEKARAQADSIMMFDQYHGYLVEARIHQYEKDPLDEETSYLKAIAVDPRNLLAYRALWWFYMSKKDETKANDIFARAVRSVNRKSDLYYYAGLYYVQSNDLGKALEMFRTALSADSTNVVVYYQLGKIALLSGRDLEKGLTYFNECLQTDPPEDAPTWPYVHWRMGMIYEKLGKKDSARSEYKKALEMDSHFAAAKKALDALK